MANAPSGVRSVDSLSANEFQVEIGGEIASGIFGVSGLCPRYIDVEAVKSVPRPVIVSKMVQQNPELPFNRWTRETLANPTTKITREIAIVAMDEGVETRRWVLKEAWISAIAFSDFDQASQELVAEQLTIHHSGIQEIWPPR